MDSPPTYSTRDGWRQGTQIASIPRGETIRMCETREIGFFVAKQRWHRVQWRDRIGWIDDSVITGAAEGRRTLHASLFASAYAHDAEPARSNDSAALWDPLIGGSFIAMLLGMFAKPIYDYFRTEASLGCQALIRQLVPPLVISPVVFFGIVKTVSVDLPGEGGLLTLFLFAFQNGFFWQNTLETVSAQAGKPAYAGAKARARTS